MEQLQIKLEGISHDAISEPLPTLRVNDIYSATKNEQKSELSPPEILQAQVFQTNPDMCYPGSLLISDLFP